MTEERPDEETRTRMASKAAARARIQQQQTWVDLQVKQAMERGDFDDLPGAGKPIPDLGTQHDPDWWLKKMVERERIAVLPPSLQLRKEDAEMDDRLDAIHVEKDVRRTVEEFNERVIAARYGNPVGPPLVTMPRDVEETVDAWKERRAVRRATAPRPAAEEPVRRRRWWQRTR